MSKKRETISKMQIRLLHHNGVCWEVAWEGPFAEDFVFTAPKQMCVSGIVVIGEQGLGIWKDLHMGTFNFSPGDEMHINFSFLI